MRKAVSMKHTGVDRIVEDICNPNGHGRKVEQRIRAKATLRITKPI